MMHCLIEMDNLCLDACSAKYEKIAWVQKLRVKRSTCRFQGSSAHCIWAPFPLQQAYADVDAGQGVAQRHAWSRLCRALALSGGDISGRAPLDWLGS